MFKKYIYTILILCFASHFLLGQNTPGYLGKKAFLDYNFTSPFPLYLGENYNNFVHNFRFNYVMRRRAQVALSFDLFKLEGTGDDIGDSFYTLSKIKGSAIGCSFDWYSKTSIAPLGNYLRLEYKYILSSYEDLIKDFGTERTEKGDYNTSYFGIGYGIRRIFFDKMVFNVGGSFGVTPSGLGSDEGHQYTLATTYLWQMHVGVGYLLF